MIAVAKRRGIPVVFAIHNFGYTDPRHFSQVDYCIVRPSSRAGIIVTGSALTARRCPIRSTGSEFASRTATRAL